MAVYSKVKNVNTSFGGAKGIVVPNGATADRDPSVVVGTIRYNTDLGLIEQYNALGWQSVDAPPTVSSITGIINENSNSTITITGSNFKTGAIVSIEGPAVSGIPRNLVTTYVSATQLTAASNAAAVNYVGGQVFDVKVTNPSGLASTLASAGTIDRDPLWTTPAGSLGTVFDRGRSVVFTVAASDPDGTGTISYSLTSGSLPSGATLNSSSGAISGFSAVASDTTSTFTLRATSSIGSQTADRTFSITVRAPTITAFTSTGSSSFSVPTGVTSVEVLVVAGGGGGGGRSGGGGGAGGVVYSPSYPVSPGGSIPLSVGGGGNGNPEGAGSQGSNTVFGVITANGGGFGGNDSPTVGNPGGSGGGAHYNAGAGSATQGSFPAVGGTGYGNSGASGTGAPTHNSGGGGGAGAAGAGVPTGVAGGEGGAGRQFPAFPGYGQPTAGWFGGGGAGGGHPDGPTGQSNGGTGGGGTSPGGSYGPVYNGGTNTGGGGAGCQQGIGRGGNGGPGIVLVKF